jgi:septal ring factor EnvC (AmiA/AmiB activator)
VDLRSVTLQADRARAEAEGARLKRDQVQAEAHSISSRKDVINRDIQRLRTQIRKQVRWMQALGPLGGINFIPTMADFQQFLIQERYLTWWRNQERRRLGQIQQLQGDLAVRERELQDTLTRLAQAENESSQLQASLRLNEEKLQKFLDGLQQDEVRQRQIQAELSEEALQLERMLGNLIGKPRTDAFEPTKAFSTLRGELAQPVVGSLALSYGEHVHPRFHTKTMNSGLLIAANVGATVQAVADGKVVYADLYQGYGPMVILDHGDGFFTLYTHLEGLKVAKGQVLRKGEALGAVGETMDGPRLGFEIRYLAQPQDPQKWLKTKYR